MRRVDNADTTKSFLINVIHVKSNCVHEMARQLLSLVPSTFVGG
jgi:hypothetical protein